MDYSNLDKDTRDLIESMCYNTGKTKEQSILALTELGMMVMIAARTPAKKDGIINKTIEAINGDEGLKKTAEAYKNYWTVST